MLDTAKLEVITGKEIYDRIKELKEKLWNNYESEIDSAKEVEELHKILHKNYYY